LDKRKSERGKKRREEGEYGAAQVKRGEKALQYCCFKGISGLDSDPFKVCREKARQGLKKLERGEGKTF